ncbi:MAG TPA: PDDEXK nuclease domain-containing protein [Chitinophagales bacterium]|nr:PDDEXK nuclease domain-containing protein [Chitinophagales bacterium]
MGNTSESKYLLALAALKERIKQSRLKAVLAVNHELLRVYWEIGMTILEQQKEEGWGSKVIDRLSSDLKREFPDFKGVSVRNLKYMRVFAEAYPDFGIVQQPVAQIQTTENEDFIFVQQPVAQIPWSNHVVILEKVKNARERAFYIQKTIENGWSRAVLSLQIENKLFERQGQAISNFTQTLPATESDLVAETFKNPYIFNFITLSEELKERDIERGLIQHLKKFMLELGRGFAYVGNQYNLNVEGEDFFLDLLFYNFHLHCFVTFELKVGDFKPEFAGKLNFYINTIDSNIKGPKDNPTIGILLCKTPNETVVKYSLQGITTPMGVAEYKLEQALPNQLKGEIPTIEEFEAEIDREYTELRTPTEKKFDRIKDLVSSLKLEGVKEPQTEAKCMEFLTVFLVPLKESLEQSLKEATHMFLEGEWSYLVDGYRVSDKDIAIEELGKKKIVKSLGLQLNLKGFKPAGIKAFNIHQAIFVEMHQQYYKIGEELFPKSPWYENVYHILPGNDDVKAIEDKFIELVFDSITTHLERIASEK